MSIKRKVNVEVFKSYLKSRDLSITQLSNLAESSEKTIKRGLKDGYVTLGVAIDLCRVLQCNFIELFGEDDSPQWKKSMVMLYKTVR